MNMKNVKAITIPEGTVKKIEDANGNIIWGSYDAFPYRRLEYIHFNGTDNYIDPGVGIKSGYFRRLDFDLERNNVRQSTFCLYDGTSSLIRYYLMDIQASGNANGTRACCASTWSTAYPTADLPLNTKLQVAAVNSTVNSKPRMFFNLRNMENNTKIIRDTTLDGTTAGSLPNTHPYIMGCHTLNTGVDRLENPTQGKVYYFEERTESYLGNLTKNLYPCQRKSDGKYGMYSIIENTFYVLQGTQNSTSGGPIVDEYWDLTAPS